MNLRKLLLTNNECYKVGKKIIVKGIMVHSTGANNPNLKRYVGPDDGLLGVNQYNNHWNQARPGGRQVCVHAFIGKLADGTIATYQTLPWDMRGWHSASGSKGAAHDTHIGFEICEDGLTDATYFNKVYQEAVELCAYLCKEFNLDPMKDGVIIGHYEGHQRGIASNHGDPKNWFPKHGKSMDTFRSAVKALLGDLWSNAVEPKPPVVNNPPTTIKNNEKTIWDFLSGKALNDYAVAGIMGNLYAESGLNANNLQNAYEKKLGLTDAEYTAQVDNGKYTNFVKDSAGYGLAQWTYWSRKEALLKYAQTQKKSIGDLTMQLEFLWKELQGYKAVMNVLNSAKSIREASDVILTQYEKPADQSEAVKVKRANFGKTYYDKYATKQAETGKVLYRVQTGAFSKKANANALAAKLKAKGHDTYIVKVGDLYKVQCGAFSVKANADKLAATLKSQGFETFITK